jgi:HlyD family secretion protein
MNRALKITILLLAGVLVVGGASAWYLGRGGEGDGSQFRTAAVRRGEIVSTIGATGTVEPEEVVDVGAQVAGQIISFGKDKADKEIDYGSEVHAGMILAQIDDSLYKADAASAAAQLEQAKAGVTRAQADIEQLKAKLDQARRDWDRAQRLGQGDALSQEQYDTYRAAYETAQANLAVGGATLRQDQAAIPQAEAVLQRAQRNLSYCVIKSPVDGVIIDRRVNIGQTVVSSLNAPSLFLIAKDLTRMEVWASVNEADIGSIHSGQPVTFTVDAQPGRTFVGQVGKVRLNAQMTQNVVTYTVEIVTENKDGALLPYLTANVHFETARREDALLVPTAALRWTPDPEQIAPDARGEQFTSGQGSAGPTLRATRSDGAPGAPGGGGRRNRGGASSQPSGGAAQMEHRPGTLWVLDGKYVRPVHVRAGISDNMMTEVSGEGVTEGMTVVSGDMGGGGGGGGGGSGARAGGGQQGGSANPFIPQFPGRRRGG